MESACNLDLELARFFACPRPFPAIGLVGSRQTRWGRPRSASSPACGRRTSLSPHEECGALHGPEQTLAVSATRCEGPLRWLTCGPLRGQNVTVVLGNFVHSLRVVFNPGFHRWSRRPRAVRRCSRVQGMWQRTIIGSSEDEFCNAPLTTMKTGVSHY